MIKSRIIYEVIVPFDRRDGDLLSNQIENFISSLGVEIISARYEKID
jgi:hypothetical protein